MYSKSSTFLALSSILVILAVLSIAINNVQDGPVRRPFSSSAQENPSVTDNNLSTSEEIGVENNSTSQVEESSTVTAHLSNSGSAEEELINDELKFTAEDQKYFQENFKDWDSSLTKLNFDNSSSLSGKNSTSNDKTAITSSLNNLAVNNQNTPTNSDQLVRNVNNELLRKVGYSNFIIKPKPFSGKIFDKFDISMLGSLNIIEKDVLENQNGNEIKALEVYEFTFGNKDTATEIYTFLKAKIKNELGTTINETNQFGLSSFYINLEEQIDRVFLVVKTRDNVYALSYPKAKSTQSNYLELTSALLKELL